MKIAVASDHAGFKLKEKIKSYLNGSGHTVFDCGASSEEKSDYPDFAKDAAERVSNSKADRGVLVCGSGIGMCMAANRFKGVRAAVIRDATDAELSRRHNDANVACLGARLTPADIAIRLIGIFLSTPFEGGRHITRIKKIDEM